MSVVEDVRKAMQDFLAPELGELKARVEALEKRMDERFNALNARVDAKFQAMTDHMNGHFNTLNVKFQALTDALALSERVARLEERESHKGKEQ